MAFASARFALGAPGVFRLPPQHSPALIGVRMDVSGFAGVAPRGPAYVPEIDEVWRDDDPYVGAERGRRRTIAVPVESFDEYRRLFGGFEGPGMLPYAVAAYFENGGRRAYVARIVPEYRERREIEGLHGVARGRLGGFPADAMLFARNEGDWGNRLRVRTSFQSREVQFHAGSADRVLVPDGGALIAGTLLRFLWSDGALHVRFVEAIEEAPRPHSAAFDRFAVLDSPLPTLPAAVAEHARIRLEVIELQLEIDDGAGTVERFDSLGLSVEHPRWAAQALYRDSALVYPGPSWSRGRLGPVDETLAVATSTPFAGGRDRYAGIEHEHFFDSRWTPAEERPGAGITAFAHSDDLASIVVPDLYVPRPLPASEDILDVVSVAGPTFERCVDLAAQSVKQVQHDHELPLLRLDPLLPDELRQIIGLQQRVVEFAEQVGELVALLDVPPGLNDRKLFTWRAAHATSYAAAYHPWLHVARRDDLRDRLVRIPPSAVAAGIIARSEIDFGIPHGPANALANEVVKVDKAVSPALHAQLHPQGVNVYLQDRDGVRLTGARTLSHDSSWRQLSVRRLLISLRRALRQQMQWVAFEPNDAALRAQLRTLLQLYLRRLYRAGAFKGATEEEAFFVRCDEVLNSQRVLDAGHLIAEIGVAPAEPLEFIVLRLARQGDGTLTVEE